MLRDRWTAMVRLAVVLGLAGGLAWTSGGGPALGRPLGPDESDPRSGYALAATWPDVGRASRVVAGPDGQVYVLSDRGILRLNTDGAVQATLAPSAPRLLEIAVDASGTVYGANLSEVRRLDGAGRTTWSTPIDSPTPSELIPYPVIPYVASLAWDGSSGVTLLYDRWKPWLTEWVNHALLESRAAANGGASPGPDLMFPTHVYWDLDYRDGRAYVLDRTTTELRGYPQVEVYEGGVAASVPPLPLPAPAERLAAGPDGSVFVVSEGRWLYHVAADGQIRDSWDAAGSRPALRSRITDLAVDVAGRVYVADPEQGQVRVYARQPGVVNPPPRPGGSGLACSLVPDKWAEPTYLRLGEATQVTLTLGGACPAVAERADIVLVVDQSYSMSYEGGAKMQAARDGVRTFVNMVDTSKHQLGLVAFGSYARLLVGLTQDRQAILNRSDQLQPLTGSEGGTDIAGGLNVAVDELLGPRARKDEQTKPIIILLTDGVAFNTTRLSTAAVADRARAEGITVFSIGFGNDVDPDLLRLVARSPDLYEFAPRPADLQAIYEKLGRVISALFLLKEVTIVDEVPANMQYRPDLGAEPPPAWVPAGRTLTWRFSQVAFGQRLRMTYWLEPLEVGTWPTNVQAIYTGTDGFDQAQRGPFPIPRVVVWAPTATPTSTASPSPSVTASPSETARPSVTPSPTATPTGTFVPPSLTPTRRPSPTATRTRTVTPTPSATPLVSPTPSATPTGDMIYLTIVFNDRCFKRYADTVLVLDVSTTMLLTGNDGRRKLDAAKAAVRAFLDELELAPDLSGWNDQAALVWFNETAVVQQGLTNDRAALERALEAIRPVEGSRLDLGLLEARRELALSEYRRMANNPVIVFLSDGIPNHTTVEEVIGQADKAKRAAISVYSVGFGEDVRDDVMRRIASQPEMYHRSQGNSDVEGIYREIAGDVVCR